MWRIFCTKQSWLLALLAILCGYFWIDLHLAVWFHQVVTKPSMTHSIFAWLTELGNSIYYIVTIFLAWVVTRWWVKRLKWSERLAYLLSVVVVSGIICDVIKILAGRSRPIEFFNHNIYGFHLMKFHSAMWSFPSGHTTTITAMMVSGMLLWPRYWFCWFLPIIAVAVSRLGLQVHYFSDIVAGFYLGGITAVLLYKIFTYKNFAYWTHSA